MALCTYVSFMILAKRRYGYYQISVAYISTRENYCLSPKKSSKNWWWNFASGGWEGGVVRYLRNVQQVNQCPK